MMTIAAITILIAARELPADTLRIWADRTAWLESRGIDSAVGDNGRSRGRYQIQRATWARYSRAPWRTGAHDPRESRRVAMLVLRDCSRACRRDGLPVTFARVRWYYRHGGY